jgi:hypothetical protein
VLRPDLLDIGLLRAGRPGKGEKGQRCECGLRENLHGVVLPAADADSRVSIGRRRYDPVRKRAEYSVNSAHLFA